jgi:hypothetical protein
MGSFEVQARRPLPVIYAFDMYCTIRYCDVLAPARACSAVVPGPHVCVRAPGPIQQDGGGVAADCSVLAAPACLHRPNLAPAPRGARGMPLRRNRHGRKARGPRSRPPGKSRDAAVDPTRHDGSLTMRSARSGQRPGGVGSEQASAAPPSRRDGVVVVESPRLVQTGRRIASAALFLLLLLLRPIVPLLLLSSAPVHRRWRRKHWTTTSRRTKQGEGRRASCACCRRRGVELSSSSLAAAQLGSSMGFVFTGARVARAVRRRRGRAHMHSFPPQGEIERVRSASTIIGGSAASDGAEIERGWSRLD